MENETVPSTQQINSHSSLNAQTPTAYTIIMPVAKGTISSRPNLLMLLSYYGKPIQIQFHQAFRFKEKNGGYEDVGLHRSCF